MRHAEDELIHGRSEVHVIQVIWKNIAIEIHINLQLTCPFVAALFLRLRCEEYAVKDRTHGEHTTHDGTCCVRTSERSELRGKKIRTYKVKKSQTSGAFCDGQQGYERFCN